MPFVYEYETKQGKKYGYIAELGMNPDTGKRTQKKKQGFKTKNEALLAGAEVEKMAEVGRLSVNKKPTFEEVFMSYWELKKANIKPSTQYQLECVYESTILPRFRKMKINDISIAYCQQQVNDLVQYKSASAYKALINSVFKYALKTDLIHKNPMEFVELPRKKKKKTKNLEKNFLEKNELMEFLSVAKKEFDFMEYVFFHVLFFSGMRKGELKGLEWKDIDFARNEIDVECTLTYSKENGYYIDEVKNSTPRTLDMDPTTMKLLKEWKLRQPKERVYTKHDLVFSRVGGYPLRLA